MLKCICRASTLDFQWQANGGVCFPRVLQIYDSYRVDLNARTTSIAAEVQRYRSLTLYAHDMYQIRPFIHRDQIVLKLLEATADNRVDYLCEGNFVNSAAHTKSFVH